MALTILRVEALGFHVQNIEFDGAMQESPCTPAFCPRRLELARFPLSNTVPATGSADQKPICSPAPLAPAACMLISHILPAQQQTARHTTYIIIIIPFAPRAVSVLRRPCTHPSLLLCTFKADLPRANGIALRLATLQDREIACLDCTR